MNLTRSLLIVLLFILAGKHTFPQTDTVNKQEITLNNFVVKENLLRNNKIAIIATDKDEKPLENVSGTFQFSINGFRQELKFNNGFAIAEQPIERSTFLYLRHENETGTHGKLYYIYKKADNLHPIKISWLILILIPLGIILLAVIFRKFLIIAAILLLLVFFFNSQYGLKLPMFFDTVMDGIKSVF
jgi:hypothetical protein